MKTTSFDLTTYMAAPESMPTGLVITTYNRPDALHLVLDSVVKQTSPPMRIYIADDGSGQETADVVSHWSRHLPIEHLWQPDSGFRAARVRNLALQAATTPHLVFVDGDCILPPDFIARHRQLIEPMRVVSGGRVLLNAEETAACLRGGHYAQHFRRWKFRSLPLGRVRDWSPQSWQSVRTCNLGLMRSDALRVAGFDEKYEGWGREDSDFVVRLLHCGCRIRQARFAASVLHLHHPEATRDRVSANDDHFRRVLADSSSVIASKSLLRAP